MGKISMGRLLAAAPFFLVGAGLLLGVIATGVYWLALGPGWEDGHGAVVFMLVFVAFIGGALLQLGRDALGGGSNKKQRRLIGPWVFYIGGVLVLVPVVWSLFEGAATSLLPPVLGVASIVYGVWLQRRGKRGHDMTDA